MTDEQIIQLYNTRSEQAISETAAKYGSYCRTIAFGILKNSEDSEECLSDTYLKAWESIPPNQPDPLSAFLGRITRNTALNRYKHSRAQKRGGSEIQPALEELSGCVPASRSPEEVFEELALAQLLNDFLAALAACFCLIAVSLFAGHSFYYTESSYISIDVNPSLELCLNPFDRVIAATAYNEDGQLVLDGLDLENMTYSEAISALLASECFHGYLQNDAELCFTIVSDNEEALSRGITHCAQNLPVTHSIHCTDEQTLQEAHSHHCSVGKYTAYQELAQVDETITIEDCQNMTMHEIHERIRSCSDAHHTYNSTDSAATAPTPSGHHSEPSGGHH